MTGVVLTEQRGHTLLITINCERAANSINAEVHRLLGEASDTLEGIMAFMEKRAPVWTGK